MSLSRPAISAGISLVANRIVPVKVDGFTMQEASSYLNHHLPNKLDGIQLQGSNNGETLKDRTREIILGCGDLNPEFLMLICEGMKYNTCPDEEAANIIINEHIDAKESGLNNAWKEFSKELLKELLKQGFSVDEGNRRVAKMAKVFVQKKSVSFLEICNVLDKKEGSLISSVTFKEFALWNSNSGTAHLFDVDPFSVDICVNGPLAVNVLEKALKKDS